MIEQKVKSQGELENLLSIEAHKHGISEKLALPYLRERCRLADAGEGAFRMECPDSDGRPRLSPSGSGEPMSIPEFVESSLQEAGLIKKKSSEDQGPVNPWRPESFNLTEQCRITRENSVLAARMKREAGA